MKSCVFKVFLKKGTVFKEKGWKMVENSVISIFEGVYSLVLMRKLRKTQKIEQVLEKKNISSLGCKIKFFTLDFLEFS